MMHVKQDLISADPAAIGDPISYIEDTARPAVKHLAGHLGMSLHADREAGALVLESFWASHDDLVDGERLAAPRLAEEVRRGNGTIAARLYEVPVFVREATLHAGEAVQLTWMEVERSMMPAGYPIASSADTEIMVEDAIASFGDSAVPSFAEMNGFCGALLYADWDSGRLVSETIWRDEPALAASRSAAVAAKDTGCVIRDTRDYRLVFSTAQPA